MRVQVPLRPPDIMGTWPRSGSFVIIALMIKAKRKATKKSEVSPAVADSTKLPAKYSNTQAGMNWWSFHFRTMTTGQRYLYVGLIMFVPVFIGCMIGLSIDALFRQEATYAYWGIVIGAIVAVVTVYTQLIQLVDKPGTKSIKPQKRAKLSKASTKKLSEEEKQILDSERQRADTAKNK